MVYLLYAVCAILFIAIVFFVINRFQNRSAALNEDQSRFDQHRNELLHILASHEAKKIAEAEAQEKAEGEQSGGEQP
jgi:flagellar biosynthesis/type III secretory pathway M-ring protein FliF/YscJ